jgi:hypothetical protein
MSLEENYQNLIILHCQLQSVIHTIDKVQYQSDYTRELKRFTNNYLNFLEPKVNAIFNKIPTEEAEKIIQIVKSLDDVVENTKVKIIE